MARSTVVSGIPYVVSTIDGHPPSSLADFVGAHRLLLSHDDQELSVEGLGQQTGPQTATFTEKMSDASGKDAREWKITAGSTAVAGSGFCAEHQAKF